jgi:hypothetical protein
LLNGISSQDVAINFEILFCARSLPVDNYKNNGDRPYEKCQNLCINFLNPKEVGNHQGYGLIKI